MGRPFAWRYNRRRHMESPSPARKAGGRRRHQRGSLIDDGDRWIARWREDVRLPDGTVKRVRRKDAIASKKEYPTRRMAQRKLDELLRSVNEGSRMVLPLDLRAVEVVLCYACRERLLAALQAKPKAAAGCPEGGSAHGHQVRART